MSDFSQLEVIFGHITCLARARGFIIKDILNDDCTDLITPQQVISGRVPIDQVLGRLSGYININEHSIFTGLKATLTIRNIKVRLGEMDFSEVSISLSGFEFREMRLNLADTALDRQTPHRLAEIDKMEKTFHYEIRKDGYIKHIDERRAGIRRRRFFASLLAFLIIAIIRSHRRS